MPRDRAGRLGVAAAIVFAVFVQLGLFVLADRSGVGQGASAGLTEQVKP